jgi:hypothetical protein
MLDPGQGAPTEHVLTVQSTWSVFWFIGGPLNLLYVDDERSFATFIVVDGGGEPVTIGGSVSDLVGSGLVLQNNGGDDLSIVGDGPFTFVTPLTPGDSYDVTVFTQPKGQTCRVENGSGQVPTEDVTNVAVACDDEAESQGEQIISTWVEGILYWDAIESTMRQMTIFSTMADIAAGDFSGDGSDDVASIWDEGLFYQDGVTLGWELVTPSAPIRVTAGDVTGDGRDEIIGIWDTGNVTDDGIWYYDFATLAWTQMTFYVGATDIAAGDFTGDGKADVASIWPDHGLFYQNGANLDEWIEVDKSPPIRVTAGDITGDGRDEIIANWSVGLWYWDVAAKKYTQIPTISPPIGDLAAGDFTGDGIADVAAIYDSGLWWVDGASPTWKLVRGTDPAVTGEGPWSVTAGDVK